jgi:hypothetical protein
VRGARLAGPKREAGRWQCAGRAAGGRGPSGRRGGGGPRRARGRRGRRAAAALARCAGAGGERAAGGPRRGAADAGCAEVDVTRAVRVGGRAEATWAERTTRARPEQDGRA